MILNAKLKLIEEIEPPNYVYDLSIANNHNFVANQVIISNCHHIPASTCSDTAKNAANAYYRIGVSATPWRDGGDDILIEAAIGKRDTERAVTATKLTELGYLVPATIYFIPINVTVKGQNYHKVYTDAIVNNKLRNYYVTMITTNLVKKRDASTLVLIQRVEHGQQLLNSISEKINVETFNVQTTNVKTNKNQIHRVKTVEFLSGKDDPNRRKAVLAAVKNGKCKVLIASTIADEGLDVPNLDCLILAGAGKSSTRAFQRIGRTLRPYTDPETGIKKDKAIIFDFLDQTPMLLRHSKIRMKLYKTEEAWTLKKLDINSLID